MCGLRLQQMLGCSNWSLILKRKEMPEQNYAVATVPLPSLGTVGPMANF